MSQELRSGLVQGLWGGYSQDVGWATSSEGVSGTGRPSSRTAHSHVTVIGGVQLLSIWASPPAASVSSQHGSQAALEWGFQEGARRWGAVILFYDLASEVIRHQFCRVVFPRSTKFGPHSRGGELVSTSWRKKACQRMYWYAFKPPQEVRRRGQRNAEGQVPESMQWIFNLWIFF